MLIVDLTPEEKERLDIILACHCDSLDIKIKAAMERKQVATVESLVQCKSRDQQIYSKILNASVQTVIDV